ncbi:unnamed protein product [Peniophora sp. CBMAI 1063]|nr:unnamed protein product [Peniophora sp. CBMAI 1063]
MAPVSENGVFLILPMAESLSLNRAMNYAEHTFQSNPILFIGSVTGLILAVLARRLTSARRRLPPGPLGLPLLGNTLQLTGEKWILFSSWRKIYGDLFYLNAVGKPIIVINKASIAVDLLDRRATRYIDRPPNIVAWEMITGGLFYAFGRFDEVCRRMRRASQETINKAVVHGLDEYMMSEALVLARNSLQDASAWTENLHHASGSVMLACLYGEPALDGGHDPRIEFINQFSERITRALLPGAHWVEVLPWMRHIPSIFAPWKRSAQYWNQKADVEFIRMFESTRDRVDKGEAQESMCSMLITETDRYGLDTRENAWLAATVFGGGAHTSAALMSWWSLAMLVYPEVQSRAQKELDAVVGRTRTPAFADLPHLPYIEAMVKELLRWGAIAPLGLPHYSNEDDVYDGYLIPKGTTVIVNVWELNRDRETFGMDADDFNPARYLDEKGQLLSKLPGAKDDGHFTYGFGRRVCVGKQIANKSLFIEIATCLWAFSLTNIEGQKLDVKAFRDQGTVVRPKPFHVNIQSRFPEALALLSHECELRGR